MAEKTAKLISFLFHPLLLPTFAVVLMFYFPSYLSLYPYTYKKVVILVVFLSTFISPLLIMLILLNLKVISDLFLSERKERFYPLAISGIIYATAFIITLRLPISIPQNISNFILLSAIIILFVFLVNFKTKLSAHMAGLGGFLGFFYVFFLKENVPGVLFQTFGFNFTNIHFFSVLILIIGIVATSRLLLKAHNLKEISYGLLLGLGLGLLSIFL